MKKTNMILAAGITNVQESARGTAETMQQYLNRVGGIDPVLRTQVQTSLLEEVNAWKTKAKDDAAKAIQEAIASKDQAENDAALSRAKETGYITRLNEKLNTCRLMIGSHAAGAAVTAEILNALKNMFAEFHDDDLAIAAIKAAVPANYAFMIVPENANGQAQKHLQMIGKAYDIVIDKAGAALPVTANEIGTNPAQNEIDTFYKYCISQDAMFSKDDSEILNSIARDNPELWTTAGVYAMRFGCADRFAKRKI